MENSAEISRKVYDALKPLLPASEKWTKVIFRADYAEGSYGMKYYVEMEGGKVVDCFSFLDLSASTVTDVFIDINDSILSVCRNSLSEEDRWSVIIVTINRDGSSKVELEYVDLSEQVVSNVVNWEKEHGLV